MEIAELTIEYRDGFLMLWHDAFGDGPEVYEAMEKCFEDDLKSFILLDTMDSAPAVCAALTQFIMGDLVMPCGCPAGRSSARPLPVYVSYAVNTRKDARGRGYGSDITKYARKLSADAGGVSMLCPAEPSLIKFYQPLGYRPWGYACERSAVTSRALSSQGDDSIPGGDASISESDISISSVTAAEYNAARELLLAGRPHIRLSDRSLRWIELCGGVFYTLSCRDHKAGTAAINETAAVAVCSDHPGAEDAALILIDELIVDVSQVDDQAAAYALCERFAASLAQHLGAASYTYRVPASSSEPAPSGTSNSPAESGLYVQAMADINYQAPQLSLPLPYFGFPFD